MSNPLPLTGRKRSRRLSTSIESDACRDMSQYQFPTRISTYAGN
jgi:hypothetical protein